MCASHGWRYQLDADTARVVALVVGIRAADSDTKLTVQIRHGVQHVHDGLADDDAVTVPLN